MRHLPALDGLRGVAVAGVLLFHAELPGFGGGFLGVSTFFTLSGFLITALLLAEYDRTGTITLRRFWLRRIRRLLPAALLALLGIAVLSATVLPAEQVRRIRGDLLAALLDVANWRFLASGQSYGDLSAGPSPVQHFWSLSIEEQFYLGFPLVALLALRLGGRRLFAAVLGAATVASLGASLALAGTGTTGEGGADAAYLATHTRAAELLVGALLAVWLTRRGAFRGPARLDRPLRAVVRARWSAVGMVVLVASVLAWTVVGLDDPALTRGGLLLHAVLVAVLLRAVVAEAGEGGPLTDALTVAPLRGLGVISYGVYLYHWPVFLVLDDERTGLDGWPLFALRLAVTLFVAALSYRLLEAPIRAGRAPLRRPALLSVPALAAVVAGGVLVVDLPGPRALAHAEVRLDDFAPTVSGASPAPESSAPSASRNGTAAAPGRPLGTTMVIGDSVLYDTAPALTSALRAAGAAQVVDSTWPGVGLTSGFDWRGYWREQVDRYDPEVVVLAIGRWDQAYLREHGPVAYRQLVDEAAALLSSRGARLVWLGVLTGPSAATSLGDEVFREVVQANPRTMRFASVDGALRNPDGSYLTGVPAPAGRSAPMRKPDGLHPCPPGAERIAAAVVDVLVGLGWSTPAQPGWEQGEWRGSRRYVSPPGGCAPR